MGLPFDATLKELARNYPRDWLTLLDESPVAPVSILTPDLSTVSAFADIVFRIGERILHLDFQSGADLHLPGRVLLYNTLLYDQYGLPVHSIVVLLHPRANRADLTGTVSYEGRPGRGGLTFHFEVIRVWEMPIADLLQGGLGTLPLAPLGRLPEGARLEEFLPGVIRRVVERIQAKAPAGEAAELLTSTFVLAGLRMARQRVIQFFQGVRAMIESDTYMYILEQGGAKEARKILLRLGHKRFGEAADENVRTALEAIEDLERLERMSERLLDVSSWQELLQTP